MKSGNSKGFVTYLIGWGIGIAALSVVYFLLPEELTGRYDSHFWGSWIAVVVYLAVQAFLTGRAIFCEKDKRFFQVPFLYVSCVCMALMVAAVVYTTLYRAPVWVFLILGTIILAANIILGMTAKGAGAYIQQVGAQTKSQRSFMEGAAAMMQILEGRMLEGAGKKALSGLYEAIRYSDYMSAPGLETIEGEIGTLLGTLTSAVEAGDEAKVCELAEKMKQLVKDRSIMCKAMK